MRIISGELKGRSINYLKNSKTRPLKDSVKENIFNIIQHSKNIRFQIHNSNVLDLYSGIGSFGIECISRGAKRVVFIEQDINASNILNQNLINLSVKNKSKIYNNKIENVLTKEFKEKFDIFFFDPPFADKKFINNLKVIKENNIYNLNNIIILHRERGTEEEYKNFFKIIDIKKYGRSKIIFGIIT